LREQRVGSADEEAIASATDSWPAQRGRGRVFGRHRTPAAGERLAGIAEPIDGIGDLSGVPADEVCLRRLDGADADIDFR
jgi:hypothetical protein